MLGRVIAVISKKAVAEHRRRHYGRAVFFFQLLSVFKKNDLGLWFYLLDSYKKQNATRKYRQCLNKAILVNPNSPQLFNRKAALFSEEGDYLGALDAYRRSYEINKDARVKIRIEFIEKQLVFSKDKYPRLLILSISDLDREEMFPVSVTILGTLLEENNVYFDVGYLPKNKELLLFSLATIRNRVRLGVKETFLHIISNLIVWVHREQIISRELHNKIKASSSNVIAFSVHDQTFKYCRQLIKEIRKKYDTFILIGGPLTTLNPEAARDMCMKHDNIAILRGEVENTFIPFVKELNATPSRYVLTESARNNIKEIDGLYIKINNEVIDNKYSITPKLSKEEVEKQVNDYSLNYACADISDVDRITMAFTRGCPFKCVFCSHVHGSDIREANVPTIIENIERVINKVGKRLDESNKIIVQIVDDDFFLDRRRYEELANMLSGKEYRNNLAFALQGSVFSLKKCMALLKERKINIKNICIGSDAFSEREIKRLGKNNTFEDIEEIVKGLEDADINNSHYLILSNIKTKAVDIYDQLKNILILLSKYKHFSVTAINQWVMPFFCTESFRRNMKMGLVSYMDYEKINDFYLAIREYPIDRIASKYIFHLNISGAEASRNANVEWFAKTYLDYVAYLYRNKRYMLKHHKEDWAYFVEAEAMFNKDIFDELRQSKS